MKMFRIYLLLNIEDLIVPIVIFKSYSIVTNHENMGKLGVV